MHREDRRGLSLNYVVRSRVWDNGAVADAGAVTWGSGTAGVTGPITSDNSVMGTASGQFVGQYIWAGQNDTVIIGVPAVPAVWICGLSGAPLADLSPFSTKADENLTAIPATLTAALDAGTAVTLQANNDITVSQAIIVNNASGNGGALTMQAGRSIAVNASITTDNGNLILSANDHQNAIAAYREAGAGGITVASGVAIDTGTGSFSATVNNNTGTPSTNGGITIAGTVTGNSVTVNTPGALTLDTGAVLTATAPGNSLRLVTGTSFTNNAGAGALSAATDKWLVYSVNPTLDTIGGLAYDFRQYNAPYDTSPAVAGNGLLYSVAPTISRTLTDTASKTYDGTTAATLTAGNYVAVTGAINGDTVVTTTPTSGTYNNRNAGTGKTVTSAVMTIQEGSGNTRDTSNKPVYGYQWTGGTNTASGNVGTINPATLTYTADLTRWVQAANNNPALNGTVTGFVSGENISVLTGAAVWTTTAGNDSTPGSYPITGGGLTSDIGNYVFVQAPGNSTALTMESGYDPARVGAEASSEQQTNQIPFTQTPPSGAQETLNIENTGMHEPGRGISYEGSDTGYRINQSGTSTSLINSGIQGSMDVLEPVTLAAIPLYSGTGDSHTLVGGVNVDVNAQGITVETASANPEEFSLSGQAQFIGEAVIPSSTGSVSYSVFLVDNVLCIRPQDPARADALHDASFQQLVVAAALLRASEQLGAGIGTMRAICIVPPGTTF